MGPLLSPQREARPIKPARLAGRKGANLARLSRDPAMRFE